MKEYWSVVIFVVALLIVLSLSWGYMAGIWSELQLLRKRIALAEQVPHGTLSVNEARKAMWDASQAVERVAASTLTPAYTKFSGALPPLLYRYYDELHDFSVDFNTRCSKCGIQKGDTICYSPCIPPGEWTDCKKYLPPYGERVLTKYEGSITKVPKYSARCSPPALQLLQRVDNGDGTWVWCADDHSIRDATAWMRVKP